MKRREQKFKDHPLTPLVKKLKVFTDGLSTIMMTFLGFLMLLVLVLALKPLHYVMIASTLYTLWNIARPADRIRAAYDRTRKPKAVAVLGPGTATPELLMQLGTLDWQNWVPTFVMAETDQSSERRGNLFERRNKRGKEESAFLEIVPFPDPEQMWPVRWFKTLGCFYTCVSVMFKQWPDALFMPPTTLSYFVCAAAYLPRMLLFKRTKIVFLESFGSVVQMSAVGRRLHRFADVVAVHWPKVGEGMPRVYNVGRLQAEATHAPVVEESSAVEKEDYVFLTAGDTDFDALMQAVDTPAFVSALKGLGYNNLKVHVGLGTYKPHHIMKHAGIGFSITFVDHDTMVPKRVAKASLVIGHFDPAALVDALRSGSRLAVVTNPKAQQHQEHLLATTLAHAPWRFLHAFTPESLVQGLRSVDFTLLQPFPRRESEAFAEVVTSLVGQYVAPSETSTSD